MILIYIFYSMVAMTMCAWVLGAAANKTGNDALAEKAGWCVIGLVSVAVSFSVISIVAIQ